MPFRPALPFALATEKNLDRYGPIPTISQITPLSRFSQRVSYN